MTPEAVLDVMNRMMWVAFEVAGPLLLVGIVVGLVVGVVQAAT